MNYTSKKLQYTLPNGTIAYFNRYKFNHAVQKAISSNEQKISKQAFYEEMADATGNAASTIKHWAAGHNAPSDLEKLQAVADYLNTELIELLETEMENITMNKTMNNTTPIRAIDFSETKNTVRDLYIRIADYIELFRSIGVNNGDARELVAAFPAVYTSIMHARLDLPKDIFTNLSSFATNYLQQMACLELYYDYTLDEDGYFSETINSKEKFFEHYSTSWVCPDLFPWFENLYISINDKSKDCTIFEEAAKDQFWWDVVDEYNICNVPNEIIINTAYTRLEEILTDYLLK